MTSQEAIAEIDRIEAEANADREARKPVADLGLAIIKAFQAGLFDNIPKGQMLVVNLPHGYIELRPHFWPAESKGPVKP